MAFYTKKRRILFLTKGVLFAIKICPMHLLGVKSMTSIHHIANQYLLISFHLSLIPNRNWICFPFKPFWQDMDGYLGISITPNLKIIFVKGCNFYINVIFSSGLVWTVFLFNDTTQICRPTLVFSSLQQYPT